MHTFTVVFTQLNVAVICVALHLEILEGIYCTSLKKKMDLLFGDRFKFRLLTVFFFNFSNLYLSTVIFFFLAVSTHSVRNKEEMKHKATLDH